MIEKILQHLSYFSCGTFRKSARISSISFSIVRGSTWLMQASKSIEWIGSKENFSVQICLLQRQQWAYLTCPTGSSPSLTILNQGRMAGFMALRCHTLYANADKVQQEVRYAPEIDDPWTITKESLEPAIISARQMISCPVFTKMDLDKEEFTLLGSKAR